MQQIEEIRMEKLNENKNTIDPEKLDKICMLKIELSDIEMNANYIQLLY